jgi:hypothetical protein
VDESCWKNSPEVVAWMQAQGFNSADQIYEYFVAEVDKYSLAMNRAPIRWSEGAYDNDAAARNCCSIVRERTLLDSISSLCLPLLDASLPPSAVWQHFGTDLDPRTVIHAWLGTTELVQATNAGYRVSGRRRPGRQVLVAILPSAGRSHGRVSRFSLSALQAIWSIDGKYYLDALGENWTAFYNVDILGQSA